MNLRKNKKLFSGLIIAILTCTILLGFVGLAKAYNAITYAEVQVNACSVQIHDVTANTYSATGTCTGGSGAEVSLVYALGDSIEYIATAGGGATWENWQGIGGWTGTNDTNPWTTTPTLDTTYLAIFTGAVNPMPQNAVMYGGPDNVTITDLTTGTHATANVSVNLGFTPGDVLSFRVTLQNGQTFQYMSIQQNGNVNNFTSNPTVYDASSYIICTAYLTGNVSYYGGYPDYVSGYWNYATYPYYSVDTHGNNSEGQINYNFDGTFAPINQTGGSGALVYGINIYNLTAYGPGPGQAIMDVNYQLYIEGGDSQGTKLHTAFSLATGSGPPVSSDLQVGDPLKDVPYSRLVGTTQGFGSPSLLFPTTQGGPPIKNQFYGLEVIRTDINASWSTASVNYVSFNDTIDYADTVIGFYYGHEYYQQNFTVPTSFWSALQVQLILAYSGAGSFNIGFPNMATIDNLQYVNPNPVTNPPSNPNTNFGMLGSMWGFVLQLYSYIVGIITFVIVIVQGFWPILPMLFIVYLIDLFYTAYKTGGVSAIGDTAYKVWQMIVDTARMIVEAIRAIGTVLQGGLSWLLGLFGMGL